MQNNGFHNDSFIYMNILKLYSPLIPLPLLFPPPDFIPCSSSQIVYLLFFSVLIFLSPCLLISLPI